jgi:hypothetical protein
LQQLVRAAAALPGPQLDVALWHRLEPWGTDPSGATGTDDAGELRAATRAEVARVRALVAGCLGALAQRVEQALGPALALARQSWDRVDDLVIVDAPLGSNLSRVRQQLEAALDSAGQDRDSRAVAAAALEGLMALEAAEGLTGLCQHRLSSLIRLRVSMEDGELLPGGRPFLDVGAALAEAARRWA